MGDRDDRKGGPGQASKFLGSLREALAAASRDDTTGVSTPATQRVSSFRPGSQPSETTEEAAMSSSSDDSTAQGTERAPPSPSAADAARDARGGTPNVPPVDAEQDRHVEFETPPTTRVVRQMAAPAGEDGDTARTRLVRGRQEPERGAFGQDPVVGWLVIVGGPGIGSYRAIFEGNNTVGRSRSNRVAIDFGDDSISAHEQAYIRYDSTDRSFLFVPNLAKTNVVSVNDKRPATAVPLTSMDVITMGRTQLVFVAFCGPEFDWSELVELKKA